MKGDDVLVYSVNTLLYTCYVTNMSQFMCYIHVIYKQVSFEWLVRKMLEDASEIWICYRCKEKTIVCPFIKSIGQYILHKICLNFEV